MKNAKQFISLLLVLLMVFAMGTTAFAADNGSITVDNPQAGHDYTAYKIFDVTYNEGKTAYSYTITTGSDWYDTVKAYADTDGSGLTLTQTATDKDTYVVTIGESFSAPAFALALQTALKNESVNTTGEKLTPVDETASVSNLSLGYYFVTSSNGALCNLTTTNPAVIIHDKNDIPFDKDDDKESVDVGTVVNYVVSGKVPDYTGFSEYMYQITDTMSKGLTFNNDVKVYMDGEEVTENITLTTGEAAEPFDFVLDIEVMEFDIGQKIEVKYSATVNEKAVAKIENNHATLEYSNDPTNSESTDTREDEETVYSAKIVIDKYVSGKNTAKLADAEFILYKKEKDPETQEESTLYYKWNAETEKVEWITSKDDATRKTTNDEGAASFDGLADGTYYLEETKAPDGYNLLEDPLPVTVNGASATRATATTTEDFSTLTNTVKVENSTGDKLPETGGVGTTIFYVLGGVLVLAAVVLLVTKKRMNTIR